MRRRTAAAPVVRMMPTTAVTAGAPFVVRLGVTIAAIVINRVRGDGSQSRGAQVPTDAAGTTRHWPSLAFAAVPPGLHGADPQ